MKSIYLWNFNSLSWCLGLELTVFSNLYRKPELNIRQFWYKIILQCICNIFQFFQMRENCRSMVYMYLSYISCSYEYFISLLYPHMLKYKSKFYFLHFIHGKFIKISNFLICTFIFNSNLTNNCNLHLFSKTLMMALEHKIF